MRTTNFDLRLPCRTSRSLDAAVAAVVTAAVMVLAPAAAWPDDHGDGGAGGPRFELIRTADFLFRVDTETGQVWSVPINGDGGWQPMGAAPATKGEGLYKLAVLPSSRPAMAGPPPRPQILRTDYVSGRAWLAPAAPDAQWTLIAEPAPDDR